MSDSSSYPKVFSLIELQSALPESALESALADISKVTPFALIRLVPRGTDRWMAEFVPREMAMDIRFAKAAELHVQVARKFDVRAATFTSESKQTKGATWPAMQ
jgi:hypothetical protein